MVLTVFLGSCIPRWGGSPQNYSELPKGSFGIKTSTRTVKSQESSQIPWVDPKSRDARYYSDLGPDVIDVAKYPAQQRYNYQIYADVCSRCHTLARSINAPVASRGFWELYILGMRAINGVNGNAAISPRERQAILDFLDYDSQIRRIKRADEFEVQTEELKRRYDTYLSQRLEELQKNSQPILQHGGRL